MLNRGIIAGRLGLCVDLWRSNLDFFKDEIAWCLALTQIDCFVVPPRNDVTRMLRASDASAGVVNSQ